MIPGGGPQGVQAVRRGGPTPQHGDFNPLYRGSEAVWRLSAVQVMSG